MEEYKAASVKLEAESGKDVDGMEKPGPIVRLGVFNADFRTQELDRQSVHNPIGEGLSANRK